MKTRHFTMTERNVFLFLIVCLLLAPSLACNLDAAGPTPTSTPVPPTPTPTSVPPTPTPALVPGIDEPIIVEDINGWDETFTPICGGASGVSQAAVYNRLAISPLIMIASGDENALNLSSELPGSWGSTKIELTELVVCIELEEEILLQTCEYDVGSDVERYQQNYNVSVYQALTGEVLDEGIFSGAFPRKCREQEPIELERLDGGIDFDPIILWLCQFVDPTCPPREPNGNYIVNDGDTCESIAADFGVSLESIIQINNLSAACELLVGTELVIP